MGEGEDEAGLGGEGDGEIIGEVLGAVEADEAVDADILAAAGVGAQTSLGSQGLAGESVRAVED